MRTTVALLMVAAFFALTNASAQSDGKTTPPEWVAIDDSLGHELGLTNDQMKQVQEADERYAKAKEAGDASALEKRDMDLRAVLLPSQYEQWKQIVKQRKSGSPPPKK
jgi:hypothetical protein